MIASDIKSNFYERNWSKFNQENFLLDYFDITWDNVLHVNENNVNKSFDVFYDSMTNILDLNAPWRKVTKKKFKTRRKPWVTTGILTSISIRDQIYKKSIKAKTSTEKTTLFKYRNLIVSLLRYSKRNHFTRYFQENLQRQKNWEGVRNIISIKPLTHHSSISHIDNSVTCDPILVSNTFNSYFSEVANSIRAKIPDTTKHFSNYLKNSNCNSFFIYPTSQVEVENCINSMKCNKASGPTSIPTHILKLLKHEISYPLSILINLSFSSGCYPIKLKTAQVIIQLGQNVPKNHVHTSDEIY